MFHKETQGENLVIYLSTFYNISGSSDYHFYLFVDLLNMPIIFSGWVYKTGITRNLSWTDASHYQIVFPIPVIHPPFSDPLQSWHSDPLWQLGKQISCLRALHCALTQDSKNLQTLEFYFPKDLPETEHQQDGETIILDGIFYHLGPNRLRKTQGIDPHSQWR